MENYLYPFLSVLVVSVVSIAGIFTLSLRDDLLKKSIFLLVSLAVGALLGDAFIHLIPESFGMTDNTLLVSIAIILGIFFFFIIEKFFHWHHHGEDQGNTDIHPVGHMMLVSDGLHNFIDGLIIGTSYLVSPGVGIATTLAVLLHEIPQEIGDFGVLIHSGYSKNKALLFNFLSALTAFAGVAVVIILGEVAESIISWIIPIAAGGFIYIASADLIPELHKSKSLKHTLLQLTFIVVGVGVMAVLVLFEA
jgi:zinc and cadmium transporter